MSEKSEAASECPSYWRRPARAFHSWRYCRRTPRTRLRNLGCVRAISDNRLSGRSAVTASSARGLVQYSEGGEDGFLPVVLTTRRCCPQGRLQGVHGSQGAVFVGLAGAKPGALCTTERLARLARLFRSPVSSLRSHYRHSPCANTYA